MAEQFSESDRQILEMCIPRNMGVRLAEATQHLIDSYDAKCAEAAELSAKITALEKVVEKVVGNA